MVRRLAPIVLALAALAVAAPASSADPPDTNKNVNVRNFTSCDNGETNVEVVFVGIFGSNFNVTSDQRVFVFKTYAEGSPPEVQIERGINGGGHEPLTTCTYTFSGVLATVTGFFTQRGN